MPKIAIFISEHGFGHAARASALINKIVARPGYEAVIFSNVPGWFFEKSICGKFEYIPTQTDVGLVQANPFHEDLGGTLEKLKEFFSVADHKLDLLCADLQNRDIDLVLCDISPLGIEAGNQLHIPSVLVENFTWDWIYEPYLAKYPDFGFFIDYLQSVYSRADYHFQADPLCLRDTKYPLFPPIFREKRQDRDVIRESLDIPLSARMILVTMGGIPFNSGQIKVESKDQERFYVIPGMDVPTKVIKKNVIFLPHNHNFFHPDLVHASDLVVGKVGYSTIAEVYSAQIPFLFIPRKNFRESEYLERFILREMNGQPMDLPTLIDGSLDQRVSNLLEINLPHHSIENGADQIAQFVCDDLLGEGSLRVFPKPV